MVNIEVKFTTKDKKEIVLKSEEAEQLFNELKKFFDKPSVSYPIIIKEYPWYRPGPQWVLCGNGTVATYNCNNANSNLASMNISLT